MDVTDRGATQHLAASTSDQFWTHRSLMVTGFVVLLPAALLLVRHRERMMPLPKRVYQAVPRPWLWAHIVCILGSFALAVAGITVAVRADSGPASATAYKALQGSLGDVHKGFGWLTFSLMCLIVATGLFLGPFMHVLKKRKPAWYSMFLVLFQTLAMALLLSSSVTVVLGITTYVSRFRAEIDTMEPLCDRPSPFHLPSLKFVYGVFMGAWLLVEGGVSAYAAASSAASEAGVVEGASVDVARGGGGVKGKDVEVGPPMRQ